MSFHFAAGLVLVMASAVFGEAPVKVIVSDEMGAAIGGAMVLVHWDRAGSGVGLSSNVGIKDDLVLKTADSGALTAALPPGFYDVFVAAMGFTPMCRKIRLKGTAPFEVRIRLPIDAQIINELGDVIEAKPRKH